MKFSYRARSSAGELRTGVVECADAREAARLLRRQSLLPLAIEAGASEKAARPAASLWRKLCSIGTVPLLQKALFFRELALFTAAGIPLGVSLQRLAETSRCVPMIKKIRRVCRGVNGGQSMSRAMRDGRFCEPVDRMMLSVGEETGRLSESLTLVAERYERRERLRSKILSALAYPALVLFFSLAVLLVMFVFVLPKFHGIFARLKIPMPALTAKLFYVSGHLPLILSFLLACVSAAAGAIWGLRRVPGARLAIDRLRLKVPGAGALAAQSGAAAEIRRAAAAFARAQRGNFPQRRDGPDADGASRRCFPRSRSGGSGPGTGSAAAGNGDVDRGGGTDRENGRNAAAGRGMA